MICKVCSKNYRSGRIAFVMAGGGLKGARVCQGCAGAGVLLVAARPAVKETIAKGPPAAAEVLKHLRAQVRGLKLTGPKNPEADQFIDGKIEGLENAIDALEGKTGAR
jgi:hypothetical protein